MIAEDKTAPVLVRMSADLIRQVDEWRRNQADIPSRPEAVRRLLVLSLRMPDVETADGKRARGAKTRDG